MKHDRTPVADPVHSFLTSESNSLDDLRSTDDLPTEADIVIIGAGFAGVVRLHHELISKSMCANCNLLGDSL